MRSFVCLLSLSVLLSWTPSIAATCPALPVSLTNGSTADATQVMADFNSILSCANANLAPLASPHFTGSVGIGTSSPSWPLQISASGSSILAQNQPGNFGAITMANPVRDAAHVDWTLSKRNNDLDFWIYGYDGTTFKNLLKYDWTNNYLIFDSGKVGIGTIVPKVALHVTNGAAGFAWTPNSRDALLIEGSGSNGTALDIVGKSTGQSSLFFSNENTDVLAQVTFDSTSNQLNLYNGLTQLVIQRYASGTAPAITISSASKVGIGTTAPAYLLDAGTSSVSGAVARFTNSVGSCTINPNTTSLSCSSDRRLKKNAELISPAYALQKIEALSPIQFEWANEKASTGRHAGFIAQDVSPVLPDLVSKDGAGYYAVNYAGFVPYLAASIQSMDKRAISQATEIALLKRQIQQLQFEMAALKTAERAKQALNSAKTIHHNNSNAS